MTSQSTDILDVRFPEPRKRRWFRRSEESTGATAEDWAIAGAERIGDIRWRWRQACEITGLALLILSPSGQTMSSPRLGEVRLGPPTTFTVRPHPGQLIEDFQAAGKRIASAMGVAAIRVAPLAGEWLVIELLDSQAGAGGLPEPTVVPFPRQGRRDPEAGEPYAA